MKLSVFPLVNYIAKTKEAKIQASVQVSRPNLPTTLEFSTEEDLIKAVTSSAWSPSVFSGYKCDDNFFSTDLMVLDIDNGLTITEAEKLVQKLGLACLCVPSGNHTEGLNKFRLIFPLSRTIYSKDVFDDTWDYLQDLFPMLDRQCSDESRYYLMSTMIDGFYQEGKLLDPIIKEKEEVRNLGYFQTNRIEVTEDLADLVNQIYGEPREKIPEPVDFFIRNGPTGIPGGWINALNSACFSLALSGVDDIIIEEVCEKIAPNPLDKKDLYQIARSIRDGKRIRETNV